jgi:hypothetical protein
MCAIPGEKPAPETLSSGWNRDRGGSHRAHIISRVTLRLHAGSR